MTTLGEILAARAGNARARGTVALGALGTVTVEALSIREIERLSRGADGDRAVFYAACREMQSAGAALLREGRVYRPDQVMALVSDAEAAKVAEAVRALSGWPRAEANDETAADSPEESAEGDSVDVDEAAQASASDAEAPVDAGEERTASSDAAETDEDKQAFYEPEVQPEAAAKGAPPSRVLPQDHARAERRDEQAFPEFSTRGHEAERPAERPQPPRGEAAYIPQNTRASGKANVEPQPAEQAYRPERPASEDAEGGVARGYAPERTEAPHEAEPGAAAQSRKERREGEPERSETMHEPASELAERVARELLDGLRRASWVR